MSTEQSAQPWDPFAGWSKAQRDRPLSIQETADALGVKRDTFRLWAVTGRVPAFQVGARWMCTPTAVITDITRERDIFARADTSVVYCALQRKLRGTPAPREEPEQQPKIERRPPGLVEPQAITPRGAKDVVPPAIVDAAGLAEILGCSTQTVYRMAKADDIPSLLVGSQWRFEVDRVLAALREPVDLWKQPGRSWAAKRRQKAR